MTKKADNIEKFTRNYLLRIDQKLDRVENDLRDIRFRIGQVESNLVQHTSQLMHHTGQFDRLFDDIALIKKRIDLVEGVTPGLTPAWFP